MDNQYLILLSLFLVGLVGFVSVVLPDGDLVSSADLNAVLRVAPADRVLYDIGGHQVCYYNGSAVGEAGHFSVDALGQYVYWMNGSQSLLYFDVEGQYVVHGSDLTGSGVTSDDFMRGFSGNPTDGFVGSLWANVMAGAFTAIVVGAVAATVLITAQVFGSGEGVFGQKVIVTVMFYSLLWVLVSAVGVAMLVGIPFFGWVFYLLLSFAYYLGVWGEINN